MIRTEKGITEFDGTGSEITADLTCIMRSALETTPVQFLIALETFCAIPNAPEGDKDEPTADQKLEGLAALLAMLPKEEQERLKKQLKE